MSPRQLARVVHGPWPGDGMLRAISDMTWRIVVNNTPSPFFTTDNPAFFFEGLGLSHDHAEVTFPLAPDLALIANWQGEAGATLAVAGSSRVVKEINRRIASGATRFVFSRQRATWIETLVHRRQPYLSRIIW